MMRSINASSVGSALATPPRFGTTRKSTGNPSSSAAFARRCSRVGRPCWRTSGSTLASGPLCVPCAATATRRTLCSERTWSTCTRSLGQAWSPSRRGSARRRLLSKRLCRVAVLVLKSVLFLVIFAKIWCPITKILILLIVGFIKV